MKGLWLIAVSLLAGTAFAQQQKPSKYYVALDVGQSRIETGQGFLVPVNDIQHGNDVGFKASFGIQISRYFAVEAGYTDYGSFTDKNVPYTCAPGSPPPCTYDISAGEHGPFTNIVGLWVFSERWSLSGRLGGLYALSDISARDPDVAGSKISQDENSFGFLYGVGLNYQVNPRVRVRLNWERNDQISAGLDLGGGLGFYELGSSRLTSLGFDYRF